MILESDFVYKTSLSTVSKKEKNTTATKTEKCSAFIFYHLLLLMFSQWKLLNVVRVLVIIIRFPKPTWPFYSQQKKDSVLFNVICRSESDHIKNRLMYVFRYILIEESEQCQTEMFFFGSKITFQSFFIRWKLYGDLDKLCLCF